MTNLLVNTYGWHPKSIRVLTDHRNKPTRAKILSAFKYLVNGAKPGDVLFLHFSGHGSQVPDKSGLEEDGLSEVILPSDFMRGNYIRDSEIFDLLVKDLPEGVRLTCVFDCCHSGTLLNLPYRWSFVKNKWRTETNPFFVKSDVTLISGSRDSQKAEDVRPLFASRHKSGGALTMALLKSLKRNSNISFLRLLTEATSILKTRGFTQTPQLSSTQPFDFFRPFSISNIQVNLNTKNGQVVRKRFTPNKQQLPPGSEAPNFVDLLNTLINALLRGDDKKTSSEPSFLRLPQNPSPSYISPRTNYSPSYSSPSSGYPNLSYLEYPWERPPNVLKPSYYPVALGMARTAPYDSGYGHPRISTPIDQSSYLPRLPPKHVRRPLF